MTSPIPPNGAVAAIERAERLAQTYSKHFSALGAVDVRADFMTGANGAPATPLLRITTADSKTALLSGVLIRDSVRGVQIMIKPTYPAARATLSHEDVLRGIALLPDTHNSVAPQFVYPKRAGKFPGHPQLRPMLTVTTRPTNAALNRMTDLLREEILGARTFVSRPVESAVPPKVMATRS